MNLRQKIFAWISKQWVYIKHWFGGIIVLFLFSPFVHAQGLELACPIGSYNIPPVSPTFNNSTGGIRQWLCADVLGNVKIQGSTFTGPVNVTPPLNIGTGVITTGSTCNPIASVGQLCLNSTTNIWQISNSGSTIRNLNPLQINAVNPASGNSSTNLSNTIPAAPANGINVIWATSTAGSTFSGSAAIIGDGIASDCLIGNGTFQNCNATSLTFGRGTCNQASASTTCSGTVSGQSVSGFQSGTTCVVTSITSGLTSYFISSVTVASGTATVNITYAPSQAASFYMICIG